MRTHTDPDLLRCIAEARQCLGIRRLALVIHDASFPAVPGEDIGRGSPYTTKGAFLRFAADLGFDTLQLGPTGQVTLADPSPYNGALESRNALSIALGPLADDPAWSRILDRALLDRLVAATPPSAVHRVEHRYAWSAVGQALAAAFARFSALGRDGERSPGHFERFRTAEREWLHRDETFLALCREHGTDDWTRWPAADQSFPDGERLAGLGATHSHAISQHAFTQYLVAEQHADLRRQALSLGLRLFGDLQVGISHGDRWGRLDRFLPGYALGAPPSRTNPSGQPWGYPVFDPRKYREPGGALALLTSRVDRLLHEFDGLRIDHPHGLVCPWVYRTSEPAPARGARLRCSPDLPDHPELAPLAIVRRDQLTDTVRWADDWVRELDSEQVERYGLLFDAIVERALAHGLTVADLVCEVLSTFPYPLRRVMARHGLGRFRIAQKADLRNPADVYRSENAAPEDWVMLGNPDTPPIWLMVDRWRAAGELGERAAYLASRLIPDQQARTGFAAELEADGGRLVEAMCAELLASPAENVALFFPDLFGMKEIYNRPGVVDQANWTLRVPPDYASLYPRRAAARQALSIPRSLALALRARGAAGQSPRALLADRLDRFAESAH